jgi:hypothetical protein
MSLNNNLESAWTQIQYYPPRTQDSYHQYHINNIKAFIYSCKVPNSWEEFDKLSHTNCQRAAEIISILCGFDDFKRSSFHQGVLQQYKDWLSWFWYYTCEKCGFPTDTGLRPVYRYLWFLP